ncbi:HAD-IB family hydrolase [Halomonas meridiana]|uniref:HAD family hydrolase n=1 Tax=Vreelandella aquamarina TaxID=77097 RepID=UPI00273B8E8B|nr:HAD-IB family hydrolase [Halomonas meridiana]MDP4557196.1 HAD-IB family hydrolase [Halomonas meridiana]
MSTEFRFAFFDVDETLIKIKSMFDFYHFWCYKVLLRPDMHDNFEAEFSHMLLEDYTREELNRSYYRYFTGVDPKMLNQAGAHWALERLEHPDDLFIAPVIEELQRLQGEGITPVFVSGSFHELLEPIANSLKAPHILATKLEIGEDGLYTGNIISPQTIGIGKALAIQNFLQKKDTSPKHCYAFGDDISDLHMLNAVGYPVVVGTESSLAKHAAIANWRIISTS